MKVQKTIIFGNKLYYVYLYIFWFTLISLTHGKGLNLTSVRFYGSFIR